MQFSQSPRSQNISIQIQSPTSRYQPRRLLSFRKIARRSHEQIRARRKNDTSQWFGKKKRNPRRKAHRAPDSLEINVIGRVHRRSIVARLDLRDQWKHNIRDALLIFPGRTGTRGRERKGAMKKTRGERKETGIEGTKRVPLWCKWNVIRGILRSASILFPRVAASLECANFLAKPAPSRRCAGKISLRRDSGLEASSAGTN